METEPRGVPTSQLVNATSTQTHAVKPVLNYDERMIQVYIKQHNSLNF